MLDSMFFLLRVGTCYSLHRSKTKLWVQRPMCMEQRGLGKARERKEKGKDLSLKGSLKARLRPDPLLHGHLRLHLRG